MGAAPKNTHLAGCIDVSSFDEQGPQIAGYPSKIADAFVNHMAVTHP